MTRVVRDFGAFALIFVLTTATAWAQLATAELNGRVTDSSGGVACDVMRPNVPVRKLVCGLPQLKWFVRLNASRRSSRVCPPPTARSLETARSMFHIPGPLILLRT